LAGPKRPVLPPRPLRKLLLSKVGTRLILASASPRRCELLAAAGFEFESIPSNVAEEFIAHLTLRELTLRNALRKGISVARLHSQKVVLAADTLVEIENRIIGKPANLKEAAQILRCLSGRLHRVCSAVFICFLAQARSQSFCEISHVQFRRLTSRAVRDYLTKVDPLDKAGAYAAQGAGSDIIERIEGSFTNVVGLPMERTVAALRQFGIEPKLN
jgi:septum formation protein